MLGLVHCEQGIRRECILTVLLLNICFIAVLMLAVETFLQDVAVNKHRVHILKAKSKEERGAG